MGADHALGIALEMAIALSTGDDDDHVRRTIADKLIALARTGERNPDVLCDKALEAICTRCSTRASWPAVIEGS